MKWKNRKKNQKQITRKEKQVRVSKIFEKPNINSLVICNIRQYSNLGNGFNLVSFINLYFDA